MSQNELKRALVMQRVVDGHLSIREAALILGLSERQTKRLKKRFLEHGAAGLAHGNRGRRPAHAIPDEIREKVLQLAQTKYRGCNYTFLSELLREHEGIFLSPSSVRRILRSAGIPSPRRHRPPRPHYRRQRKPQLGMLVLIDTIFRSLKQNDTTLEQQLLGQSQPLSQIGRIISELGITHIYAHSPK